MLAAVARADGSQSVARADPQAAIQLHTLPGICDNVHTLIALADFGR